MHSQLTLVTKSIVQDLCLVFKPAFRCLDLVVNARSSSELCCCDTVTGALQHDVFNLVTQVVYPVKGVPGIP